MGKQRKPLHDDHQPYYAYTTRSRLDKAVNSLLGIIEGIAIDSEVNPSERALLEEWISQHVANRDWHPFNELIPPLAEALKDGKLDKEEAQDLKWLCEKLRSEDYFDAVTADMQRLHGILGGIMADGVITEAEIDGLAAWMEEHQDLRTCWPYEEIETLVMAVMQDRHIDEKEQKELRAYFTDFLSICDSRTIVRPPIQEEGTIRGLCATCPKITFKESLFCFTGASDKYSRTKFEEIVGLLGGSSTKTVTRSLNYLVIGAEGNPCWSYACYGRKIECAVELRKQGCRILLVHENDFHDAVHEITGS